MITQSYQSRNALGSHTSVPVLFVVPQSNFSQKRRRNSTLRDPLRKVRIAFWAISGPPPLLYFLGLSTRTVPSLLVSSTAPDQTRIYLGLEVASPLPPSFFVCSSRTTTADADLRDRISSSSQAVVAAASVRTSTVIAPPRSSPVTSVWTTRAWILNLANWACLTTSETDKVLLLL